MGRDRASVGPEGFRVFSSYLYDRGAVFMSSLTLNLLGFCSNLLRLLVFSLIGVLATPSPYSSSFLLKTKRERIRAGNYGKGQTLKSESLVFFCPSSYLASSSQLEGRVLLYKQSFTRKIGAILKSSCFSPCAPQICPFELPRYRVLLALGGLMPPSKTTRCGCFADGEACLR